MTLFLMSAGVVTALLPLALADRFGYGIRPGFGAGADRLVIRAMVGLAGLILAVSVAVGVAMITRDVRTWQGYLLVVGTLVLGFACWEVVPRLLGSPSDPPEAS
ncbi:hypothetical protein [Frankia sp. AvcI1]|uniref:hypothetical protein n=1 Tax=Frankia sp. AvcI1 TaxID=573496 RepID=UPI00211977FE|nr:hypothetical protein [Frankia sp. AvcI1]